MFISLARKQKGNPGQGFLGGFWIFSAAEIKIEETLHDAGQHILCCGYV